MPDMRETLKYTFTVEGKTEQWYCNAKKQIHFSWANQRLSFLRLYKNTPIWDRGRQNTLKGSLPDSQELQYPLRSFPVGLLWGPVCVSVIRPSGWSFQIKTSAFCLINMRFRQFTPLSCGAKIFPEPEK